MSLKNKMLLLCCLSTMLASSVASAQMYKSAQTGVRYYQRCLKDQLSNAPAVERVFWYAGCYPDRVEADMEALLGESLDQEIAREMYFSYHMFIPSATTEGGWKPMGARVMYPIFENGAGDNWKAPVDRDAPCLAIPAGYKWMVSCRSSCYKPEMQLAFAQGDVTIKAAYDRGLSEVVVLDEQSTLENIGLTTMPVWSYTASDKDKEHKIVSLTTATGGHLEITTNHPLIDGQGMLREAATFVVGDALVREDGSLDEIVEIDLESYFGKVYNILPNTQTRLGNVVIAEGFLSGSEWYQNEASDQLNSMLLRSSVPQDALQ